MQGMKVIILKNTKIIKKKQSERTVVLYWMMLYNTSELSEIRRTVAPYEGR